MIVLEFEVLIIFDDSYLFSFVRTISTLLLWVLSVWFAIFNPRVLFAIGDML
jgi:hypothetical protein